MARTPPLDTPCRPGPTPAHHGGRRAAPVRWVVIHSTEGGTASSVADYFASTPRSASAHLVVDQVECLRLLPDDIVGYHAPPINEESIGVEIVGYAKWSRLRWLAARRRLKRAAWHVARILVAHDLPAEWRGPDELIAGLPGLTLHRWVSAAWHRSTHWDPGPGFPRRRFLRYVRAARALQR